MLTVEELGTQLGNWVRSRLFTFLQGRSGAPQIWLAEFVSFLALHRSTYSLHLSILMFGIALHIFIKIIENGHRMFNVVVIE
jgi:hypothetical protein